MGGVTAGVRGTKTPSGRDHVELDLGAALALPAALTDPVAAAGRLVAFALGAGGEDNITAVLARFTRGPASDPRSAPA